MGRILYYCFTKPLEDDSNYNSETLDDVRCDSTYLPIEHYEKYTKEDIVKKIQYFSANLITDESDEWYSDSNFIESFTVFSRLLGKMSREGSNDIWINYE